ncbi:hypothetical protein Barb7_00515 [Bacteroidales bacterium Barb7]|nr:hypothetical protein Barb7_00515 [Bacteroidales bacterium Barb7]
MGIHTVADLLGIVFLTQPAEQLIGIQLCQRDSLDGFTVFRTFHLVRSGKRTCIRLKRYCFCRVNGKVNPLIVQPQAVKLRIGRTLLPKFKPPVGRQLCRIQRFNSRYSDILDIHHLIVRP